MWQNIAVGMNDNDNYEGCVSVTKDQTEVKDAQDRIVQDQCFC